MVRYEYVPKSRERFLGGVRERVLEYPNIRIWTLYVYRDGVSHGSRNYSCRVRCRKPMRGKIRTEQLGSIYDLVIKQRHFGTIRADVQTSFARRNVDGRKSAKFGSAIKLFEKKLKKV